MTPSWWRRLFPASEAPDFVALLRTQADFAVRALDAMAGWCAASQEDTFAAVMQVEKDADKVRRAVAVTLSTAFETPLDREDINDLSRRLDDVVDGVRNAVREAAALRATPDATVVEMLANVRTGLVELGSGLECLPRQPHAAFTHAEQARHTQRANERIYAAALAQLIEHEDFRTIFRQREIYQLLRSLSVLVELACEGMMHAINKLD